MQKKSCSEELFQKTLLRRLVSEGGSSDDKRTTGHPGLPYSAAEEVLFKKHCLKSTV